MSDNLVKIILAVISIIGSMLFYLIKRKRSNKRRYKQKNISIGDYSKFIGGDDNSSTR
ncbi:MULTISPECIES: hypothetical protein [Bacteroides]|uniref:hypothetical protein n=1 Tax=Bacteroides TaxID=816 RepID=UPI00242EB054|nr:MULTISPECIES: hypothetical protein [Bacteroides]